MLKSYVPGKIQEEFIMMNTGLVVIANMTEAEIKNFDSVLEAAIKASECFNETVRNEFVNFAIDYETSNMLSTFFITAFLKAVKNRNKTGIACHLEKFDEELQNIDAVCESNPDIFRSNYTLMKTLMQFHTAMGELARALGMN